MPTKASQAFEMLGVEGSPTTPGCFSAAADTDLGEVHRVGKPTPLFKKLTPEEVARIRDIVTNPTPLEKLLAE